MQRNEKLAAVDKLLQVRTQLTKVYNDFSARGICSPEKNKIKLKIKEIDEALIQYRIKDNVLNYDRIQDDRSVISA